MIKGRKISAPSYWPHSYWQQDAANDLWAKALADPAPLGVFIVNPSSGPGAEKSQDWVIQAGIIQGSATAVGYVSTDYANAAIARDGSRTVEKILEEIQQHVDWYGVGGVFLDEVSNGWNEQQSDDIEFYRELMEGIRKAHGKDFVTVANCGTIPREEYLPLFDIIVTFEQHIDKYLAAKEEELHPAAFRRYSGEKFWHMVHDITSEEQARTAFARANKLGVRHVYLTDGSNDHEPPAMWGNPYGVPPADWLWEMHKKWAAGLPLVDPEPPAPTIPEVTRTTVAEMINKAISAIPKPEVTRESLSKAISDAVASIPKHEVTRKDVEGIVAKAVASLPKTEAAPSVTEQEVRDMVAKAVANAAPRQGSMINWVTREEVESGRVRVYHPRVPGVTLSVAESKKESALKAGWVETQPESYTLTRDE